MKYLTMIVIGLLLAASVAATGVIIRAQTKEAGLNDVAYYAYHDGNSDAAERLYRMALAENPSYELARYNLATLLFQEGRFTEAATELETLISLDPGKAAYHYDLAVNLVEEMRQHSAGLDQFDRAIAEYETANRLSPGFEHVNENLAVLYKFRADAQASS